MNGDTFEVILSGVPYTLALTFLAFAIGALLGIPLVIARRSRVWPLRWLARAVTEIVRGLPPIVWLFIIYFGLGTTYLTLDAFTAATLGLGVISAAYMAEIYRGGLSAIHSGQWEAAAALGMSKRSTLVRIIGPQIVRVSVPASASYVIGLLKESSVAFTIGVTEIVYYATSESRSTSEALGPYLVAALIYVAITIPCAWGARAMDSSLRKRVAR